MDLYSGVNLQDFDSASIPSLPVLWNELSLVLPEEVDRTVEEIQPTTSRLGPCQSWLL